MSNLFDNSRISDHINALYSVQNITDLSFDITSQHISVRKVATVPFFGYYISWFIFKFSSQATIDKIKQDLLAFHNSYITSSQEKVVKHVDELFQQCQSSFSEDINKLKSFKGYLRVFSIAISKHVTPPTVEATDELKNRIIKELRVLTALDKGKVTPEMKISIKVLFNLGQILADVMKQDRLPSFRGYISDADIPDRKISSLVPIFKKCEPGPCGSISGYLFDEEDMSYHSFREHIREEIKNTVMLSIRKTQDVSTKLQEWRDKTSLLIADKAEKFFKLNTKLVKFLTQSQKESLKQEMTQIYTELFPEVIESVASSIKS